MKQKKKNIYIYTVFHLFRLVSCCQACQSGGIPYIFPVTGIVREQKPQSFYTDVMDGVSSLVEMVSNRLVSVVFYVSQMFLEAGVEGATRFADVEFGTFGAMNNVHNVLID